VAFADDPKSAYQRIILQTNKVAHWLKAKSGKNLQKSDDPSAKMVEKAIQVVPVLRGIIAQRLSQITAKRDIAMPVMDLRAGPNIREFFSRPDLPDLAYRGLATPDHVIRTKNYPLFLSSDILKGNKQAIEKAVDAYIANYTHYFTHNASRHSDGKIMLNPVPDLAWIEEVGLVGMGHDARAAAIASDLGEQNITAMSNAENCGGFRPVSEEQLFDMEYWSLEQAKLGTSPLPALSGRIVLITGGAGAIGLATAQAFGDAGASVFLIDLQEKPLAAALEKLGTGHGGLALDITASSAAQQAIDACVARFGGLDILVSNAGAAWTGEMSSLDDAVLRKSFELNFFAHQTFAKAAMAVFEAQNRGGQILFNVSKQAVNPGKGFGAYGLPKATTMFLLRQLALELGPKGVRVNGINADRIRSGLLDDAFISARSKARGIDEGAYMAGNLLQREVEAHHVADAFVALALSERTTAHVMTVDGGNIEAALR
jgi:NAD(P)-dependent dehydrogenase (short-subunit alcohol dehydrogenase family)